MAYVNKALYNILYAELFQRLKEQSYKNYVCHNYERELHVTRL